MLDWEQMTVKPPEHDPRCEHGACVCHCPMLAASRTGPVTGCACSMCERLRELRGEPTRCVPVVSEPLRPREG